MAYTSDEIDFDLHGVVGIRVVGAQRSELEAIRRQLGPIERPIRRPRRPEITIRFMERLDPIGPIRQLESSQTAHDDERYYVLRDDQSGPTRTAIPMDRVGGTCEILCGRGTRGIRLLVSVVNLSTLSKGLAPVHGSAFVYRGRTVLIVGWAKGGKTETLLGFAERGAKYVGDEWVFLDPQSGRIYGLPEPIRLWEWHLRSAPAYRKTIDNGTLRRLGAGRMIADRVDALAGMAGGKRSAASRLARRGVPILRRQLSVQVPPSRLFGPQGIAADGPPVDLLLWGVSREAPGISLAPVAASQVAARMAYSVAYEWRGLFEHYLQFRYAFPNRPNPLIDEAPDRLARLLDASLGGLPAYEVAHPYPVAPADLYQAVRSVVEDQAVPDSSP